jgi:hypothetical protein
MIVYIEHLLTYDGVRITEQNSALWNQVGFYLNDTKLGDLA